MGLINLLYRARMPRNEARITARVQSEGLAVVRYPINASTLAARYDLIALDGRLKILPADWNMLYAKSSLDEVCID